MTRVWKNRSKPRGHDEMALFIIPTVAVVEESGGGLLAWKSSFKFRLVVLFKDVDRPNVIAKNSNAPFVAIEVA